MDIVFTLGEELTSAGRASRALGIPIKTITAWRDGFAINADVREMVRKKSLVLTD